jgi:hypothetical protein
MEVWAITLLQAFVPDQEYVQQPSHVGVIATQLVKTSHNKVSSSGA